VISRWVRDQIRPGRENIDALAKFFKKPVEYFSDDTGASIVSDAPSNVKRTGGYEWLEIPDVGTVSASQLSHLFELPPESFLTMGMAFHKSGDALGEALKSKDMNRSLAALSETLGACVSCHDTFRH